MKIFETYNFIKLFENSIQSNWDLPAISVFDGKEITYEQLGKQIKEFHILWNTFGLNRGDKIGICANNCSQWIIAYMSVVTAGYIAVLLQPNTTNDIITKLINHSECKIIYASKEILNSIDYNNCSNIVAAFEIKSNHCEYVAEDKAGIIKNTDILIKEGFLKGFSKSDVKYNDIQSSDECTIVYTSGTTGDPKGSIISVGYFGANICKMVSRYPHNTGDTVVCLNPFYHIFGLGGDILTSLCSGMCVGVINQLSPSIVSAAMKKYKPKKVFAAPAILLYVLSGILGKDITIASSKEEIERHSTDNEYYTKIGEELIESFGGNLKVFLTGGAAISPEIESFLVEKIGFPLVTVYGLTESGPVSLGIIGKHKLRSGGTIVKENKVRIASSDPQNIPGEIQIKENLFSGYYKNEKATQLAFTPDGWLHSGDIGIIDKDNVIFIIGRCKDMLLTSNGENIYPEDIETVMNSSPYIKESILVQKGEKLRAIIVPDREKADADRLDLDALNKKIDEAVREASKKIPGFTIVGSFELRHEPLERTPKGSLKRFLYSENIRN